jgi:hypothetical protein
MRKVKSLRVQQVTKQSNAATISYGKKFNAATLKKIKHTTKPK